MKKTRHERTVELLERKQRELVVASYVLRVKVTEHRRKIAELDEASEQLELARQKLYCKQLSV